MLTTSASLTLGIIFVLLGAINIWLVLEAWSRVKNARVSSRMLALHRIGGYIFIAVFCAMTYYMLARLGAADSSPTVTLHLTLAMLLSPLLFVKVLIARYYKSQHGLLMPIGLTIFVLAFVLVASTAGPHLARPIDVSQARELTEKRCSKCHNLDRVVGARKDAQGWAETIDKMRKLPGAGISDTDVQIILTYLESQNQAPPMQAARALVDQRCNRCHSLDRVYRAKKTPQEWRETVDEMSQFAAGSANAIPPGDQQQILAYLSQAIDSAAPVPAAPSRVTTSRFDPKTAGFFSLLSLSIVALILRRPGTPSNKPGSPPPPTPPATRSTLLLELVQITTQTADSQTLRFAVRGKKKLEAQPGQFLTFAFLFDGRKETRCYSICSSPARTGYIEITPKRVPNGCVSVFLNDRATIGMTVEVTGPFGQFCLTPADTNIVLLAAGSGITPMMAMLRYIDDLCLGTQATLIYCVRTGHDIIFGRELEELQSRLKNFRYRLVLSKPGLEWQGPLGHITRDLLEASVPDLKVPVFFLCGPPPFMDAARTILTGLDVGDSRIRQETFGGTGAAPKTAESRPITIEFARSGKSVTAGSEQSLLAAATENGVPIPSACRQGQCGTCKTRLLEGSVRMTAEDGLDPDSRARGYILTCVGHAEGNVRLDA